MNSIRYAIIGFFFAASLAKAQTNVIINSLSGSGSLVFSEVSNAVGYRIEWAASGSGPWTNFSAIASNLDDIAASGSGVITATVPMMYRVVANVVTADFTIANSGSSSYLVNGQLDPALNLIRGRVYTLDINSPGHPLWIKFFPSTGTGNQYNTGLSTNGIQVGELVFTVPYDAPDTLYYICQFHSAMQGVINITGDSAPAGMVPIPEGTFVMGNTFDVGPADEVPLHTNYISNYYIDAKEVTKRLWDDVRAYGGGNGYYYTNPGAGVDLDHPVHSISWYDAIRWCNARSEMEGLTPVYYDDEGLTNVYKTSSSTFRPFVNWLANGYRLPTEAEWEKAARGGLSGKRFPWGDTITHSNANYRADPVTYSYDVSETIGNHPYRDFAAISNGTTPAGYFLPNGYGLYDVAGNISEWCWDAYSDRYYSTSPSINPRNEYGPMPVIRGGSYNANANALRVSCRSSYPINFASDQIGFRCARGF